MNAQIAEENFRDCGGPYDLSPAHSITSWESQPTTCAEQAVIRYLVEAPARYANKDLLHMGIGNGELFASLGGRLGTYTGVTISRPELSLFRQRFPARKNARAILANKHDSRSFRFIGERFDIIVDVNLKSFACCEKHFQSTMIFYAECLSSGGMIITAQSGLDFGWAGNAAVAYTPGADTDPGTSRYRVLGADGLAQLCARLNLTVDSVPLAATTECETERLWILRKV